ncbi:histidine kinase [Geotalea uraniireducens]|uniref:Histidine kinase n=1 Tax=Geotalea uraniireducens TaxID=351604 RepID=A0ABM8ENN9_9BACT|nr:histidine kinase [Geotalea uraniireducens]BDV44081.1 histidine kinase [Geotalea uraniireducens]
MKKKVLAVAAAGALTVATAVPALALENEFHGMFRVFGTVSNYADGGSGTALPKETDPQTKSFVEQRARLMYIAKANDDLKLVTHFEIDSRWGDNSYTTSRNVGGAIGADTTNLETKNVYLDFNIPSTPLNVKVGIQPVADSFKGIFINADAAAILATAKLGNGSIMAGFSRLDDADTFTLASAANRSASTPGKATRDLYLLDGKYGISKDLKVGAAYYVLTADQKDDPQYSYTLHTIGVNGEYKFDPVTVDGFVLYQLGRTSTASKVDFGGWAANLTAKAKVGPGTLKATFLYASGEQNPNPDDSSYVPVTNETSKGNAEHSFNEADMMIMFRNKWNVSGDRAILYNIRNVIGGFVGYNAPITSKLFANANVGFVAADKNNDNFGTTTAGDAKHDSQYLGTELNAEVGYKVYDNLTASLQGAYVMLGDYFKRTAANGQDPRDPYLTRIMLNYAF